MRASQVSSIRTRARRPSSGGSAVPAAKDKVRAEKHFPGKKVGKKRTNKHILFICPVPSPSMRKGIDMPPSPTGMAPHALVASAWLSVFPPQSLSVGCSSFLEHFLWIILWLSLVIQDQFYIESITLSCFSQYLSLPRTAPVFCGLPPSPH